LEYSSKTDLARISDLAPGLKRGFRYFLPIEDRYREWTRNWREVLPGLKNDGLAMRPKVAVRDRSLGFWAVLPEIFPKVWGAIELTEFCRIYISTHQHESTLYRPIATDARF